jgi:hypothetical protein
MKKPAKKHAILNLFPLDLRKERPLPGFKATSMMGNKSRQRRKTGQRKSRTTKDPWSVESHDDVDDKDSTT